MNTESLKHERNNTNIVFIYLLIKVFSVSASTQIYIGFILYRLQRNF